MFDCVLNTPLKSLNSTSFENQDVLQEVLQIWWISEENCYQKQQWEEPIEKSYHKTVRKVGLWIRKLQIHLKE